jgi:nucleoporin GLE1
MALADEDSLRRQGQQREQKRKQLQHQHQQTAQQHKASVERIEAEQRRQLEAVRAAEEAQRQAQLEEQRRKQAEEEAKRQAELQEQQRKQQEEAQARSAQQQQQHQQQQAAAARPAGASGAPVASVPVSGPMAVSQMAKDWAQVYERKLKEAEQATSDFASSAASKADRRKLEKEITKFVQQISGTQRQVAAKVADLTRLLSSAPAPAAQLYACIVLANKLLSQCDAQITKLPSFAFPLAVVAVRVGVAHPQFMDILVAKLHRVCTFTVPQYPRKQQGQAAEEYAKALGYKEVEAGNDGSMRLESSDEFSSRLQAYVLLYAAITQVSGPGGVCSRRVDSAGGCDAV